MCRSFLFLQGPATPFFARLGNRLRAEGHAVHRIHFCAGDVVYGGLRSAIHFRGPIEHLSDFLDETYRRFGITDQVLFGDRRPIHRPAVDHGQACGVRTHVFEEGYFRPYWITLEREGVNGHSLLPRDPDWFRETGARLGDPPVPVEFASPFWVRAVHDVAYHVAGLANPHLFPRYRTHAGVTAPVEYAGYLRRFARLRLIRVRERRRAQEIAAAGIPYYVLPLQLNSDAQIRDHSRFEHMGEVIGYVLESFARHAPPGGADRDQESSARSGVDELWAHHPSVRAAFRPCRAGRVSRGRGLGDVGQTRPRRGDGEQHGWDRRPGAGNAHAHPERSDLQLAGADLPGVAGRVLAGGYTAGSRLFSCFRRCVMHATQVNGGFYCATGIALAVENSARVLAAEPSPLERLL